MGGLSRRFPGKFLCSEFDQAEGIFETMSVSSHLIRHRVIASRKVAIDRFCGLFHGFGNVKSASLHQRALGVIIGLPTGHRLSISSLDHLEFQAAIGHGGTLPQLWQESRKIVGRTQHFLLTADTFIDYLPPWQ